MNNKLLSKKDVLFQSLAIAMTTLLLFSLSISVSAAKKKAPWVGKRFDGKPCANENFVAFGPYDYLQRRKYPGELQVVESSHFNKGVETLTKGMTTEPMGDLDYTLGAWPNHHRALITAMEFRKRHPRWPERSKGVPAECYLQRAINFSPNDGTSYLLYGMILSKQKRYKQALPQFRKASKLLPGAIAPEYNTALTLMHLKKYGQAKAIATRLYDDGFPLPGLKNQLIAVGRWEKEVPEGKTKADQPTPTKEPSPATEVDETGKKQTADASADSEESEVSEALDAENEIVPAEASAAKAKSISIEEPESKDEVVSTVEPENVDEISVNEAADTLSLSENTDESDTIEEPLPSDDAGSATETALPLNAEAAPPAGT